VGDPRNRILLLPLVGVLLWALPARGNDVIFRGKVVRDDGSALGHMVTVQRVCEGEETPVREGVASGKTGEYYIRLDVDAFSQMYAGFNMVPVACMLEA
jgi:hypothetical protein